LVLHRALVFRWLKAAITGRELGWSPGLVSLGHGGWGRRAASPIRIPIPPASRPEIEIPIRKPGRVPLTLRACAAAARSGGGDSTRAPRHVLVGMETPIDMPHLPTILKTPMERRPGRRNAHVMVQARLERESPSSSGHVRGPEARTVHDAPVRVGARKLPPADARGPGAPARARGSRGVFPCAPRGDY